MVTTPWSSDFVAQSSGDTTFGTRFNAFLLFRNFSSLNGVSNTTQ
jgi:hypothetical protein